MQDYSYLCKKQLRDTAPGVVFREQKALKSNAEQLECIFQSTWPLKKGQPNSSIGSTISGSGLTDRTWGWWCGSVVSTCGPHTRPPYYSHWHKYINEITGSETVDAAKDVSTQFQYKESNLIQPQKSTFAYLNPLSKYLESYVYNNIYVHVHVCVCVFEYIWVFHWKLVNSQIL